LQNVNEKAHYGIKRRYKPVPPAEARPAEQYAPGGTAALHAAAQQVMFENSLLRQVGKVSPSVEPMRE